VAVVLLLEAPKMDLPLHLHLLPVVHLEGLLGHFPSGMTGFILPSEDHHL